MKFFAVVFLALFTFSTCNIPQVEDAKCTASRETVRSFYAEHFAAGDRMGFTRENVAGKEKFFTPELHKLLLNEFDRQEKFAKENPGQPPFMSGDPFTVSQEYPSGFKVGECAIGGENNASHTVQLFWISEDKPINRAIKVEAEKRGDKWLVKDITGDDNGLVKILSR